MPMWVPLKQAVTAFNEKEYAKIAAYAKKHGTSVYALLKKALREFMEKHP